MLIITKTMADTIADILIKYQHGEPLDIKTNNDINEIKSYLSENVKTKSYSDILKDIDDTEKEIRQLKNELSKKYDGKKIKLRYRNEIKDAQIHGIVEESVNYRAYLILVKFDDIKTPVAYNEQQFEENLVTFYK